VAERLSDRLVKSAYPERKVGLIWDAELRGFGLRLSPGAKSFILNYRRKSDGAQRRWTIGQFPAWSTAAAREEAARLKRAIDGGADPVGEHQGRRTAPTMAELCDRFIEEYLPRKRPSTQTSYRQQIEQEIRPALGKSKVASISFADCDGLHRTITKRGAPYRANRCIALLSRMFSMAVRWGLRPDNPCKGIERNFEQKRRRYLSPDELGRLTRTLAEYSDEVAANAVRLLLLTGARRGEVLAARWSDFDLESGTWSKPGSATKQKSEHNVPLSEAARQLLMQMRTGVASDFLFPKGDAHRRDIQHHWVALCRMAQIEGARLHDLRHTHASILASAGLSLPIIGALLGHATPVTTARYSHLFDDPLRRAVETVAAAVTGKPAAEIVALKAVQ
jgi:integrase